MSLMISKRLGPRPNRAFPGYGLEFCPECFVKNRRYRSRRRQIRTRFEWRNFFLKRIPVTYEIRPDMTDIAIEYSKGSCLYSRAVVKEKYITTQTLEPHVQTYYGDWFTLVFNARRMCRGQDKFGGGGRKPSCPMVPPVGRPILHQVCLFVLSAFIITKCYLNETLMLKSATSCSWERFYSRYHYYVDKYISVTVSLCNRSMCGLMCATSLQIFPINIYLEDTFVELCWVFFEWTDMPLMPCALDHAKRLWNSYTGCIKKSVHSDN